MIVVQGKLDEDARHALEERTGGLKDDLLSWQKRAQDAEAAQRNMTAEHKLAMEEMQRATAEGRNACALLAGAQERASNAEATSERSQQVCHLCC